MPRLRTVAAGLAAASLVGPVRAYDLTGGSWLNGDIVMHLQLGTPAAPLLDGSTDWNVVAEAALGDWNVHLQRCRLTTVRNSTAEIRNGNRINNVVFRPDVDAAAHELANQLRVEFVIAIRG